MKVIITGAAGFIGSHVVDAFCQQGHEVIGIDSLEAKTHPQGQPGYLNPDCQYLFQDVREVRAVDLPSDVEVVVHLAALGGVGRAHEEPELILQNNVGATAHLVGLAPQWTHLKHIVLAGSFSVYGSNYSYRCSSCGKTRDASRSTKDLEQGHYEVLCTSCHQSCEVIPVTTATPPAPLETYAASKLMQELCFSGFTHCPVHVLRFSSVYGPRMRLFDGEATIIAKLAGWISQNQSPVLHEDGNQVRDWVFVGDVAAAIQAVTAQNTQSSLYNVCTGQKVSLKAACEKLIKAYGASCELQFSHQFRPGDMRHCLGDAQELTDLLKRCVTGFDEGIQKSFV